MEVNEREKKLCKYCAEEIYVEAKICRYCGKKQVSIPEKAGQVIADQGSPETRPEFMDIIYHLLIGIVVIAGLIFVLLLGGLYLTLPYLFVVVLAWNKLYEKMGMRV